MKDIVEMLRERARGGYAHDLLDEEAADEIERLQAKVRKSVWCLSNILSSISDSHGSSPAFRRCQWLGRWYLNELRS